MTLYKLKFDLQMMADSIFIIELGQMALNMGGSQGNRINIKIEVVKISGKRYDPHNVKTKTFAQFTGLIKPFIQSNPMIK